MEKVDCGDMAYNTRSAKQSETSQHGSMRSLQQDVQGAKESTDERIDKLHEAIVMLVTGMQGLVGMKPTKLEMLDEEEETPVNASIQESSSCCLGETKAKDKGVFRNLRLSFLVYKEMILWSG